MVYSSRSDDARRGYRVCGNASRPAGDVTARRGCFLRGAAVCSCMVADTVTGIEIGGGL
jgi:hypothetical protein